MREASQLSADFLIEVQSGNIARYSMLHKFGRNDNIPSGGWALISPSSPSGAFPASGVSVRVKASGNAADTDGGAGAREITVIGLDTNLMEVSETIVTSGINVSLSTTTSFWRVYRAFVSAVGAYTSANTGNIVIEDSDGINDMLTINADEGQTQHGAYSVPIGKTGYLMSVDIDTDGIKAADFRLFVRENLTNTEAPMSPKRLVLYWDGVLGQTTYRPRSPNLILPALTDIWIEARGSGANTEVSIDFEILLIDDLTGPVQ